MLARWGTFSVGLGLIFAPLVFAYPEIGPILHDVAIGMVVCILALAALENPSLRFLSALPAAWLIWIGRLAGGAGAGLVEIAGGALLVASLLLPRARLGSERGRAGSRA
jgi:hypothetical protein